MTNRYVFNLDLKDPRVGVLGGDSMHIKSLTCSKNEESEGWVLLDLVLFKQTIVIFIVDELMMMR